jgi:hypothetical protein
MNALGSADQAFADGILCGNWQTPV